MVARVDHLAHAAPEEHLAHAAQDLGAAVVFKVYHANAVEDVGKVGEDLEEAAFAIRDEGRRADR